MIYLVVFILLIMLAREHVTLERLIWLDAQLLYVGSFGRYTRGETISALAWDLKLRGKWQGAVFVPPIDWVFRIREVDHCRKAWVSQINLFESKP